MLLRKAKQVPIPELIADTIHFIVPIQSLPVKARKDCGFGGTSRNGAGQWILFWSVRPRGVA